MSRKTLSMPKPAADPAPAAASQTPAAEASSLRAAMGEILRTVTAPGVPAEVAIGGVRRIARGALGVGDEA